MADEKKPEENNQKPLEGAPDENSSTPNQTASDESQKRIKELEDQIKERDAKLSETQTTLATIEARKREIESQRIKETTDAELQSRINKVVENTNLDPESAKVELGKILSDTEKRAAEKALNAVQMQTTIERIRNDIKTANTDLDEDLIDDIMDKADQFAMSGKYRNPKEAIEAATKDVRMKLERYANKKNAVPKLPTGARAEGGGNNAPPAQPAPQKEISDLEELEQHNAAKFKKTIR